MAMVGAKAAGGHGGRKVGSGCETPTKLHEIFLRRSTIQVYVRRKKSGGRFKTQIKLVPTTFVCFKMPLPQDHFRVFLGAF